MFNYQR